jgi:5-methylcytosine-specific restriction endonuclease McrA
VRSKTSIIWKIDRKVLQNLLDSSNSIVEVLTKLNYDGYNGNHRTLKKRIKEEKFDLTQFELNAKNWRKKFLIELRDKSAISKNVLTKNSSCSRHSLKRFLIKNDLLSYECAICKNKGEWQNQTLSLNLDHINGINDDNRLENLRFLCPNCHSQTDTFSGKRKKIIYSCPICFNRMAGYGATCPKCVKHPLKFEISREELYDLIVNKKIAYLTLGKRFNVSDAAIKKRCKKLGIPLEIRRR